MCKRPVHARVRRRQGEGGSRGPPCQCLGSTAEHSAFPSMCVGARLQSGCGRRAHPDGCRGATLYPGTPLQSKHLQPVSCRWAHGRHRVMPACHVRSPARYRKAEALFQLLASKPWTTVPDSVASKKPRAELQGQPYCPRGGRGT